MITAVRDTAGRRSTAGTDAEITALKQQFGLTRHALEDRLTSPCADPIAADDNP
jgi:hypothetical protein